MTSNNSLLTYDRLTLTFCPKTSSFLGRTDGGVVSQTWTASCTCTGRASRWGYHRRSEVHHNTRRTSQWRLECSSHPSGHTSHAYNQP